MDEIDSTVYEPNHYRYFVTVIQNGDKKDAVVSDVYTGRAVKIVDCSRYPYLSGMVEFVLDKGVCINNKKVCSVGVTCGWFRDLLVEPTEDQNPRAYEALRKLLPKNLGELV